MECENFFLLFAAFSALWSLFGVLWGIAMIRNFCLLGIMMCFVLAFKILNSISLTLSFADCNSDSSFWRIISVSCYPLYQAFFLSSLLIISKGHCTVFTDISETNVIMVASFLGLSYLVYAISLINSSVFGFLIIANLLLVSGIVLKGSNNIINYLNNRLAHQSQINALKMIKARILLYRLFKKTVIGFIISQLLAICVVSVVYFMNMTYTKTLWLGIETLIEASRLGTMLMVFGCFNPFIQMSVREFRSAINHRSEVEIIQASERGENETELYTIMISPFQRALLLSSPIL
jgi:hypothetical protein